MDNPDVSTADPAVAKTLLPGLTCGVLLGLSDGVPLVTFPGNLSGAAVPARTTTRLTADDIGRSVALLFENDDPARPILIGCIASNVQTASSDELHIESERAIVLRCGKATISMRSDGRIEISGVNLISRARARNRILGGSIDLN